MRVPVRRAAPLAVALVVSLPMLRAPADDSYPLSTYPMFATDRGAVHDIATAVAVEPGGQVERLGPRIIAGTDEVVLASVTVERAVARGEAAELCAEILRRLARPGRVEVRTETVDVVAFVIDDAPPLAVTTHAACGGEG